ncbi:MAG TPA: hypothetical protein PLZ55_17830, partial [bacterium]|nr:hypothetical protein [bacterium]
VFKAGGNSRVILSAMPSEKATEAQHLLKRMIKSGVIGPDSISFSVPIHSSLGLSSQAIPDD